MKLNLKQMQTLDYLLKYLNQRFSYSENDLALMFKFDNSLWHGTFIKFNNDTREVKKLILKNRIICPEFYTIDDFINTDKFSFNTFSNITNNSLDLLLINLIKYVEEYYYDDLDFEPVLYNCFNFKENVNVNFLLVDPKTEFEVLSIIEVPKDIPSHS